MASVANVKIMENDPDAVPLRDELFTVPPEIKNGQMTIPTLPGWGTDLNSTRKAARAHAWEGEQPAARVDGGRHSGEVGAHPTGYPPLGRAAGGSPTEGKKTTGAGKEEDTRQGPQGQAEPLRRERAADQSSAVGRHHHQRLGVDRI